MNIFDSGDEEQWVVVAPKTRISPGECVPVTVGGIDLLLVASKDGSALHCISNSCPHLGTPLELGTLERRPIETKTTTSTGGPAASATATKSKSSVDATGSRKDDGCEDCIVCPLHRTAFALESGEVRGEWTPYPPVIGKLTGALKKQSNLAVFDVRIRGKNIEVKLNTPFDATADDDPSD
jgi:nitrite reductase/ring-hydroxylating ferredoxin subunit